MNKGRLHFRKTAFPTHRKIPGAPPPPPCLRPLLIFSLIDGGTVALNNQGAKIQQLTDALLTIEDLEKCQFDYETLCNHFNQDEAAPDEFLFKVTVQRLAEDSGMMLNFGFHHQVTDINSAYLVISDFCSWVREAKMTFAEPDVSFFCFSTDLFHLAFFESMMARNNIDILCNLYRYLLNLLSFSDNSAKKNGLLLPFWRTP